MLEPLAIATNRFRFRLAPGARSRLWGRLSALCRSEIPIREAVDFLSSSQTTDSVVKRFIAHLESALRHRSFASAAREWVPPEELLIIEMTQEGRIADGMAQASHIAEVRQKLRSTLVSGLIYPLILLMVGSAALALLPGMALDVMTEVLDPTSWPPVSNSVLAMSRFVAVWGLPLAATAIIILSASIFAAPRWCGRVRSRLDWYPPFALYRQFTGPEVLNAWIALMSTGITRANALGRLEASLPPYLASHIRTMRAGLYRGEPVETALDTGLFSLETIDDLRVYQKAGAFDDNIQRIAASDIARALRRLEASTRTLATLMLLFIGAGAVWVYIGIASVAFSVQSSIL